MPEIYHNCFCYHPVDLALVQSVICRPPTVEDWVQYQASPCRICEGKIGTRASFSPRTSVCPCHYHYTNALYSLADLWRTLHVPTAATERVVNDTIKYYLAFQKSLPAVGFTCLLFSGYRRSFPAVRRQRHEINHSFPPCAGVKHEWGIPLPSM